MKRVEIVMTNEEHAEILAAAKLAGVVQVATYVRMVALKAARSQ